MTHLVFIIRRLAQGGAERQLVELMKRIDKVLFSVSLIALYPGGPLWEEACSVPGLHLRHLAKRSRWHLNSLAKLAEALREARPDIVHGYMDVANLLALAAKPMGAKVVWGVRASKLDTSRYDRMRRVALRLESCFARWPDLIICNSEAARLGARERGFPMNRTMVIPNGIDTARFKPESAARLEVRARWGVSPDEYLIGLVGRLDPMKGHSVFITAASLFAARHPRVRFVLVGDGDLRRQLQEQAASSGARDKIMWAGERSDMPAVLSALDLSVSSSLFGEGFSNVLGESMACEVPCVASDVGDAAAILGNCGWLVPPGDAVGLAERMGEAMDACRTGKVRRDLIRQRIVEEFGVDKLARTTSDALLGLMGRTR